MVSDGEDDFSFDPKRWAAKKSDADKPAVTPAPTSKSSDPVVPPTDSRPRTIPPQKTPAQPGSGEREDTSFNPREWTRRDDTPLPDATPEPAQPAPSRRALLIGGGAVAATAALGAGWWGFSSRAPEPAKTPAKAKATVVPRPTAPAGAATRTVQVADADQIAGALTGAGIDPAVASKAAAAVKKALGTGELRLSYSLGGTDPAKPTLLSLEATKEDGAGIVLTATPDGFAATKLDAKLTTTVRVVRGEMDATSFYSAAVAAGIDDTLIDKFANAFSFDFNFATEVAAGDIFEGAFEQAVNPSGQPVGEPRLIYVSLATRAKSKALYAFLAPGEKEIGWFDARGGSTVRALMRTPVDGARISSVFGPRFHPVLHFMKMHKGTDFAAPTGTPIYASGNATVQWAAMKGPNGNLTILQHDNGWQTYYLHQSRFAEGVVPGARVHQGQLIGYIGTTGRSTGPHLHYEVHINGEPVDPQGIDTGTAKTLEGAALAAFTKERDRIDAARAAAA